MDKRDQFEQKIKGKLEEVAMPDLDQAWMNFAPKLSSPKMPFWKHWSMPYLFSLSLFLTSLWWHQREIRLSSTQIGEKNELTRVDTVYIRDTVYLVDTVSVIKRVVVEKEIQEKSRSKPTESREITETIRGEVLSSSDRVEKSVPISDEHASRDQGPATARFKALAPSDSSQAKSENLATGEGTPLLLEKPSRRSMAAPTTGPQEKMEFRQEKELVVGDTSNLSHPPIPKKSRPMLQVEAVNSILFPISPLIEYYKPNQQGIQIGLEWESGWGVYAGVIRSRLDGELEDEEIMELSPSVILQLPNIPSSPESLDEIYVKNRQWLFPVELRWRSLYYSGFSFESSFGLLGNYLERQDFVYEFENYSMEEYRYGFVANRQLGIDHLRLGLGSNYLFSKRLGVFLRSHYWLPIGPQGILRDRIHGFEVGAGVSVLIGK